MYTGRRKRSNLVVDFKTIICSRAVQNLTLEMTAMSNEISYGEMMLAPTLTICPVVSAPMNTFKEAGESFLSLEQMFLNFTHRYGPNKYEVLSWDYCF